MRIVLDLQACQGANRRGPIGRASLAFARAIVRRAVGHEVSIFLNSCFADEAGELSRSFAGLLPESRWLWWRPSGPVAASDAANAWRTRANEILREHFLAASRPDVVHVAHLFEGFVDDVVTSVPARGSGPATAVSLFATGSVDAHAGNGDEQRFEWQRRKRRQLEQASLLFAMSAEPIDLDFRPERCVVLPELAERRIDAGDDRGIDLAADRALEAMVSLPKSPERPLEVGGRRDVHRASTRLRLAFVSPLPPMRGAVADQSALLLSELRADYEIDLIVDQPDVTLFDERGVLPIRSCDWFRRHADDFDRVVYQMGDSIAHRHMLELMSVRSGVVDLHDLHLTGLLNAIGHLEPHAAVLADALYEAHGYAAVTNGEMLKERCTFWKYPCSLPIFSAAEGVIVRSPHVKDLAEQHYGEGIAAQWSTVPLMCRPARRLRRGEARRRLGLRDDDVLVCTFGFVGIEKEPERILRSWAASGLARDPRCRLAFVGHNLWAAALRQISRMQGRERIIATGYLAADRYADYVEACDFAVQLRADGRSLPSRTVLECLARGVPVIVNAVGALEDVPAGAAVMLKGTFADGELVQAMRRLRTEGAVRAELARKALEYAEEVHSPAAVGRKYRDAIEEQTARHPLARARRITREIARLPAERAPSDDDLVGVAAAIALQHPPHRAKQVFVDVSPIHQEGPCPWRSRRLLELRQKLHQPAGGRRLETVYVDPSRTVRYARRFTMRLLGSQSRLEDAPVEARAGDSWLTLDDFLRDGAAPSGF